MKGLNNEGYILYVVMSKLKVFVDCILEYFGLVDYFWMVFGFEFDGICVVKKDLLSYGFWWFCVDLYWVFMIGDCRYDIDGVCENNMWFIGVLYGYGLKIEFESVGVECMCEYVYKFFCYICEMIKDFWKYGLWKKIYSIGYWE